MNTHRPDTIAAYRLGRALTRHAWKRMCARSLSPSMLRLVLDYGRIAYTRGAKIYAVGRKEVARLSRQGIDLACCEGLQVVCSPQGVILTVYRNRDFRGLRPRRRRPRRLASRRRYRRQEPLR